MGKEKFTFSVETKCIIDSLCFIEEIKFYRKQWLVVQIKLIWYLLLLLPELRYAIFLKNT